MKKRSVFFALAFVAAGGFVLLAASAQQRTAPRAEQSPMRQMMRSMMSGVVRPGVEPQDLAEPKSEGAKLVAQYCAQCHNLPSPGMHSAQEWPAIAERMFRREEMMGGMMDVEAPTSQQQQTIVAYLEKHALKSVNPRAIPARKTPGALLFASSCSRCHALPDPRLYTAAEWPAIVAKMQGYMKSMGKPVLSDQDKQEIIHYLQKHAKS